MTETRPAHTPVPAATAAAPGTSTKRGFALTALIMGIVAVLAILFGWVAVILGAAAVVFGIVALRTRQSKPLAVTGIVTGAIGVVGGAAFLLVMSLLVAALSDHTVTIIEGFETGDDTVLIEELGELGADVGED